MDGGVKVLSPSAEQILWWRSSWWWYVGWGCILAIIKVHGHLLPNYPPGNEVVVVVNLFSNFSIYLSHSSCCVIIPWLIVLRIFLSGLV